MTRRVWALVGIAVLCGGAWLSAQKSTGKLTSDDLIEIQQLYAKYTYSDELVKTTQGWRFKKRATKGDVAPAPAPPKQ